MDLVNGKPPVNIIVIGYACTPKVQKIQTEAMATIMNHTQYPHVLTFFENYGSGVTLTQAWNRLIDQSKCPYVCLFNNDAFAEDGWLTKMIEVFDEYGRGHLMPVFDTSMKVGFVGPSTDNCHSPQQIGEKKAHHPDMVNQVEIMRDPMSGFCIVFKKELWEQLNGFDEKFELYAQESDFCDRAHKKLDVLSAWRKDVFIHHLGETSVKASGIDRDKERQKGKDLYWATRSK